MNFVHAAPLSRTIGSTILASFLLVAVGCQPSATSEKPTKDDAKPTAKVGSVTIEIVPDWDAPETVISQTLEISENQTLESAMRQLSTNAVPPIQLDLSGSGVTAFVQSINSIETDAQRGWTFTIDGKFATEGIGSVQLSPGQTIQWRFTTFEEAMSQ